MNHIFKYILLAIGIFVLIFFLATADFPLLFSVIKDLNPFTLPLLIVIVFANVAIKAVRWKLIIKSISSVNISLPFSFFSIISGVAAGSIFPGRIEVAKPLLAKSRYGVRFSHSFSGLIIERFFDFVLLLIIFLASLFFTSLSFQPYGGGALLLLVCLVIPFTLICIFPEKIPSFSGSFIQRLPVSSENKLRCSRFLYDLCSGLSTLKEKKNLFFLSTLSLSAHLFEIFRIYLLFKFLGVPIDFSLAAFSFAAGVVSGLITAIPGGLGVTEFSMTYILNLLTSYGTIIQSAVLIDRAIAYYFLVILGTFVLFLGNKRLLSKTEMSS